MEKMELYEMFREVPTDAQKSFNNGRFRGTDINPMWRIKMLTQAFGPCGIGWYPEVLNHWLDDRENETICSVEINLYVKVDGEWSKPIYGVGGSKALAQEKKGPYVDDECYKKAYTDAISVACKALGMGADIYWGNDRTKYTSPNADKPEKVNRAKARASEEANDPIEAAKRDYIHRCKTMGVGAQDILEKTGWTVDKGKASLDDYAKANLILDEIVQGAN